MMKKIFVMIIAVAAMVLASCGNKTNAGAANDSDSVAMGDSALTVLTPETQKTIDALTGELSKDVESKDNQKVISSLANLQAIYKNLVESGKLEEAKGYGTAIKQFVSEHADAIKQAAAGNTTIASLIEGIKNLPTTAETTADQAKAAVVSDVTKLASPAIAKGATAVADAQAAAEAVKNAPAAVKNAAENAANTAVSNAENAAKDKANSEMSKAKDKANDAINKAANKASDAVNAAKEKAVKGLGL